jgi:hypothetical protein
MFYCFVAYRCSGHGTNDDIQCVLHEEPEMRPTVFYHESGNVSNSVSCNWRKCSSSSDICREARNSFESVVGTEMEIFSTSVNREKEIFPIGL